MVYHFLMRRGLSNGQTGYFERQRNSHTEKNIKKMPAM